MVGLPRTVPKINELALNGAEQVTTSVVPVAVDAVTVGVIVMVAFFTPKFVKTLLARVWAVDDVLPSVAQTFNASNAAAVNACFKNTAFDVSIVPRTNMVIIGRQITNSTAASPERESWRDRWSIGLQCGNGRSLSPFPWRCLALLRSMPLLKI